MSKYDVDNYHLILFDRKGSKTYEENLFNSGLFKAREKAEECLKQFSHVHSYAILRVIHNSLD